MKNYIIKVETDEDIKFIDFNDDFEEFERNLPKYIEKYLINERHFYKKVSVNYFIKINDKYDFKETLKLKKKYRMINIIENNKNKRVVNINFNKQRINDIYN